MNGPHNWLRWSSIPLGGECCPHKGNRQRKFQKKNLRKHLKMKSRASGCISRGNSGGSLVRPMWNMAATWDLNCIHGGFPETTQHYM